jgi:hypothetical protein
MMTTKSPGAGEEMRSFARLLLSQHCTNHKAKWNVQNHVPSRFKNIAHVSGAREEFKASCIRRANSSSSVSETVCLAENVDCWGGGDNRGGPGGDATITERSPTTGPRRVAPGDSLGAGGGNGVSSIGLLSPPPAPPRMATFRSLDSLSDAVDASSSRINPSLDGDFEKERVCDGDCVLVSLEGDELWENGRISPQLARKSRRIVSKSCTRHTRIEQLK